MDHEYSTARGVAIRERQDIVYREAANPASAPPPASIRETPASPRRSTRSWTVETLADASLPLFRHHL
jgi:3-methylfumaryl-CoA hydratase